MNVTKIILFLLVLCLIYGCSQQEKKEKSEIDFKMPEKIKHPEMGEVEAISSGDFVELINSVEAVQIYYLIETQPEDPNHIVAIPGMLKIPLGEMFYVAETLKTNDPIYLVSLYGADARKMGQEMARYGINVKYLDGGSYRLYHKMKEENLSFSSNAW